VETIAKHADESLVAIMRACHEKLRSTRGAVLALALISREDATITCLSVGNVEGAILRYEPAEVSPYETILMRSGVVGYNLPSLRPFQFAVAPGDLLVLSTDGIAGDYQAALAAEIRSIANTTNRSRHAHAPMGQDGVEGRVSPEGIAQHITRKYFKGNDDALVLVAQFHGRP
jgi:serine phosphatase RsbU (regulator of sigma subunit)